MSSYLDTQSAKNLGDIAPSETRDGGTFEPVWQVRTGFYPATCISVSPLVPTKPDQWNAKGGMKVYFKFLIDGTPEYLAQNGIPDPGLEHINWYCVSKSGNFPLKDNHPHTFAGDKPAEWTQDPAQIRQWVRPLSRLATTAKGNQTLFGVLSELRAVEFDNSGNPVIKWGEIVGKRCMVIVDDGWVQQVVNSTLSDAQAKLVAQYNPNYLIDAMAAYDPNEKDSSGAQIPPPIISCRHWPEKKDAPNKEPMIAPTDGMIQFLQGMLASLKAKATSEGNPAETYLRRVSAILQRASASDAAHGTKFSDFRTPTVQVSVLTDVALLLNELGVAIPTLPAGESWASQVKNALTVMVSDDMV